MNFDIFSHQIFILWYSNEWVKKVEHYCKHYDRNR
jgi:hypothetical protein